MGDQLDLDSAIGGLGPWTCHGVYHGNPTCLLYLCRFSLGFTIFLS